MIYSLVGFNLHCKIGRKVLIVVSFFLGSHDVKLHHSSLIGLQFCNGQDKDRLLVRSGWTDSRATVGQPNACSLKQPWKPINLAEEQDTRTI
jgi:hypothetical protein